jgi:hypothetical protein
VTVNRKIPASLLKLLKKKYPQQKSFTVGDSKRLQKSLGGTRVPVYSKDGGYIAKKRKKVVKKRNKK